MPVPLVVALEEMLSGWQEDLPAAWKPVLAGVELGFPACDPSLELEYWEPIFPARRGRVFPGAPKGAHLFRALDGIAPDQVRCVVLGQDPYPEPGFATGRAFEAGNIDSWRELDKMFSRSVRAYVQMICAARTGEAAHAAGFGRWPALLAAIEAGEVALEAPDRLADRWVAEGVLLLNASLTLSRFQVGIDPHQSHGHLPVWRPFIARILRHLAGGPRPVAFLGFGDAAAGALGAAGLLPAPAPHATILGPHPAAADDFLAGSNPFLAANRHLAATGGRPVSW